MVSRMSIVVGGVLAVAALASCQQMKPAPAPLEPDPKLAAQWAKQKTRAAEVKAAQDLTAAEVAALEAALAKRPEDTDAREKLRVFYNIGDRAHVAVSWNAKVAARRRHILWLVEHHPGDDAVRQWQTINPAFDPAGYQQVKRLWIATCATKGVATAVLANAAQFFWNSDPRLAEQFLLQAKSVASDPPELPAKGTPVKPSWSSRLGTLYASVIVKAAISERAQAVGAPAGVADKAFAANARKTLDASSDAVMLMYAGESLIRPFGDARVLLEGRRLELDPTGLGGLAYLEKAIQLDPNSTAPARSLLAQLTTSQHRQRIMDQMKGISEAQMYARILALPDAERMVVLPGAAESKYMSAEFQEFTKRDLASATSALAVVKAYADDLLKLADRMPADPNRGAALFSGHLSLAALALRDNDIAAALVHLDAAGNAPACDYIAYTFNPLWQRVAVQLLTRGERESVARFLERYAALSESSREQLATSAARIRDGKMPEFYQRQTTAR
jgi:hypothetical protein